MHHTIQLWLLATVVVVIARFGRRHGDCIPRSDVRRHRRGGVSAPVAQARTGCRRM